MRSTRSQSKLGAGPHDTNERGFVIFGSPQVPSVYSLGVALARLRPTSLVRIGASFLPFSTAASWPIGDAPQGLGKDSVPWLQLIRRRGSLLAYLMEVT